MKILVNFGDNDFVSILREFGRILITDNALRAWNPERLTKANIADWFNRLAPILYEIVQAPDQTDVQIEETRKRLKEYLVIKEERVFIGKEVDEKMSTWSMWGNSEAVLIDFGSPCVPPSVTIV